MRILTSIPVHSIKSLYNWLCGSSRLRRQTFTVILDFEETIFPLITIMQYVFLGLCLFFITNSFLLYFHHKMLVNVKLDISRLKRILRLQTLSNRGLKQVGNIGIHSCFVECL